MGVDWDKRYRDGFYDGATDPHELLRRFWSFIPKGLVIDIATGSGRDAAFVAEKGLDVYGMERSAEAIKIARQRMGMGGRKTPTICGDANFLPFKHNSADGVLVFYFLLRGIMGDIRDILKRGGVLIYETFLKRQNEIDRRRNPEYLLDDGELISCFRGFDIIFYEETVSFGGEKGRATARFVGRKR